MSAKKTKLSPPQESGLAEGQTTWKELQGRPDVTPPNPVAVYVSDFKDGVSTAFAQPFAPFNGTVEPTETHVSNPGIASGVAPPWITSSDLHAVGKDGKNELEESVIDTDDRVAVDKPAAWPWCVQGKMFMTFPSGGRYIGSGTLVNRHHVLTAGHCIFDPNEGGWAVSVEFVPAMRNSSRPFGNAFARRLVSVRGWTEQRNRAYDFGMLILDRNIGDHTGYFGVITTTNDALLQNRQVNVTGYPGDRDRGRVMYTMRDAIQRVQPEEFNYFIDTFGGQSGSGVWSHWSGHPGYHVSGVHVRGVGPRPDNDNDATRITRVKFDRIVEWMRQW